MVKRFAEDSEPICGERTINKVEARVARHFFREYAAGKSPKRIAMELNEAGIPAPGGGEWGFGTINGNVKRSNGILNNELYVGQLVWNRQRFIKDPDTGRRSGDLAGILTIAPNRTRASQGKDLAGTQIGRPDVRAADLIEQVKLVAGDRKHGRYNFRTKRDRTASCREFEDLHERTVQNGRDLATLLAPG